MRIHKRVINPERGMTKAEAIYKEALNLAQTNNQTIGDKRDYCITLQQLQNILSQYHDY